MKSRKVAYTFIFGDYDDLKTPSVITEGWDYICFTDDPNLHSDVWDVRLSTRDEADGELETKKFAMKHLILFHTYLEGYDLSLSVGGQIIINCHLDNFLHRHFNADADLLICRHPWRDCVYEEAEECKRIGKDDPQRIDIHMSRYRREGYPPHNGLYATGIIARHHGRQHLNDMCERWFEELRNGSKRDQLSLNYALWKSEPITISEIIWVEHMRRAPRNVTVDSNFIINPHK